MLPGIGKRTAKILQSMDIHTIGEFKTAPEKLLVEVFGPSIRKIYSAVNPAYHTRTTPHTTSSVQPRKLNFTKRIKAAGLMLTFL